MHAPTFIHRNKSNCNPFPFVVKEEMRNGKSEMKEFLQPVKSHMSAVIAAVNACHAQ